MKNKFNININSDDLVWIAIIAAVTLIYIFGK